MKHASVSPVASPPQIDPGQHAPGEAESPQYRLVHTNGSLTPDSRRAIGFVTRVSTRSSRSTAPVLADRDPKFLSCDSESEAFHRRFPTPAVLLACAATAPATEWVTETPPRFRAELHSFPRQAARPRAWNSRSGTGRAQALCFNRDMGELVDIVEFGFPGAIRLDQRIESRRRT